MSQCGQGGSPNRIRSSVSGVMYRMPDVLAQEPERDARRSGPVEDPAMSLLLGLLLAATTLAGCAGAPATYTEEARCRQLGGVWRASTDSCDQSGSGAGGY